MSDILYSKLRLEVPQFLDGENATITSEHGNSRVVQMSSPITDIMLAGMEKYRVQAGYTDDDVLLGYGQIKKVLAKQQIIMKGIPNGSYHSYANLNGTIYGLGYTDGTSYAYAYIYYFDNKLLQWVSMPNPYDDRLKTAARGMLIVVNNELHLIGGRSRTSTSSDYSYAPLHVKWNGTEWINDATLPCTITSAVVYRDELHIFSSTEQKHYKWLGGNNWTSMTTIGNILKRGWKNTLVYNDEIHIFGAYKDASTSNRNYHYKWSGSGTNWSTVGAGAGGDWAMMSYIAYNNSVHAIGWISSSDKFGHYIMNPTTQTLWTRQTEFVPSELYFSSDIYVPRNGMVVFDDNISDCLMFTTDFSGNDTWVWNGTEWYFAVDS